MSYISEIQNTIPQVRNYFWKDLLQKKANFVLQKWSILASMKLKRPVYYSKEVIPIEERKWNDILAFKFFKGDSLQAEISKLVMRLIHQYDQDERETDGAMGPKLRGQKSSDTDWLQHIVKGSSKMRFECCMNSKNFSLYIRSIQGHTGGI